jgi:hypothetical protein
LHHQIVDVALVVAVKQPHFPAEQTASSGFGQSFQQRMLILEITNRKMQSDEVVPDLKKLTILFGGQKYSLGVEKELGSQAGHCWVHSRGALELQEQERY